MDGISKIFQAMGNDTRIKILHLVSSTTRPLHIKAVARGLKLDYAAVYRHVKVLEQTGLIEVYDVGRSRVLSLKNKEWINELITIAKKMIQ